jgi:hypothetical protein
MIRARLLATHALGESAATGCGPTSRRHAMAAKSSAADAIVVVPLQLGIVATQPPAG